ncbi:MAG: hypothetical protein KAI33_05555 [Elusimicrobiales bacterium]|nr:hypothetical protein [Elusimicrobiales bacterium]
MSFKCLGIFREKTNSPNRENDDTLILKGVTEELSHLGAETHLIEPENIDTINPKDWDVILPMCENLPNISKLAEWKDNYLINPVDSVLNCYRNKMTDILQKESSPFYPKTEKKLMENFPGDIPPIFFTEKGCWVKRGDVHNTCTHDVHFVKDWNDCKKVKTDFESRNIKSVVIQDHVPGDLIKFYGIGPYKWFDWFYHRPQELSNFKFDLKDLEKAAGEIAKSMDLEVYGGDAIITPESEIFVIDINSWPSFARVRDEAKVHIAEHIYSKRTINTTQEQTTLK